MITEQFQEDLHGGVVVTGYRTELARLINRGSFHGEALVLACSGADNVARCDDLLVRAERAGLVERGKYDPSAQQRFFNVNGDKLPSHHHWITKTTRWLEARDLEAP